MRASFFRIYDMLGPTTRPWPSDRGTVAPLRAFSVVLAAASLKAAMALSVSLFFSSYSAVVSCGTIFLMRRTTSPWPCRCAKLNAVSPSTSLSVLSAW